MDPKAQGGFKLLHHVAIRDARKGLFLVGNKKKIMFGVFVNYSDNLIKSYQYILTDLYGRSLKPFYDGALPQEKLEKVLETKEMKKLGVSYHSFLTDLLYLAATTYRESIAASDAILQSHLSYQLFLLE